MSNQEDFNAFARKITLPHGGWMTADELWVALRGMSNADRRPLLEDLLANSRRARNCAISDHAGQLQRLAEGTPTQKQVRKARLAQEEAERKAKEFLKDIRRLSRQVSTLTDLLARREGKPEEAKPELLSIEEAAEIIGSSVATLRWWRHEGKGPASFRVGRRVVYDRVEITTWLANQPRAGGQR